MAAALGAQEREFIAVSRVQGRSMRWIAGRLGRSPSTVSRELRAHAIEWFSPYSAVHAQREADRDRRRLRAGKLAAGTAVRAQVVSKLNRRWSPRQIAAWLRLEFPDQAELHVSHETIYQAVYLQGRGNLRAELTHQKALRSGRTRRRSQAGAIRSSRPWLDLHISDRPAEVEDRAVPGHWEGDLLIGRNGVSAIATLVERYTRYVMLVGLPAGRVSEHVVAQLSTAMSRLPGRLLRTLTWDQGSEMAQHARFSVATGCEVYFCDPHSPWQRGSNENTNGLLRDYFPSRSTDFTLIDQASLDAVADELNTRPRQTLAWATPAAKLAELLNVASVA